MWKFFNGNFQRIGGRRKQNRAGASRPKGLRRWWGFGERHWAPKHRWKKESKSGQSCEAEGPRHWWGFEEGAARLPSTRGVWWSTVSSPSSIRGRVVAQIIFCTILMDQNVGRLVIWAAHNDKKMARPLPVQPSSFWRLCSSMKMLWIMWYCMLLLLCVNNLISYWYLLGWQMIIILLNIMENRYSSLYCCIHIYCMFY